MYSKDVSYKALKQHHDDLHRDVFFRLLELRDYANPHLRKKYYPAGMTRQQVLAEAAALFNTDGLDATRLHPYLVQSAIMGREYELAQLLLDKGMSLQCYSQKDDSNFLTAFALSPDTDVRLRDATLEKVLLAGINPNDGETHPSTSDSGSFPLNYAVGNCDHTMVETLLQYQASPHLKTARDTFFPVFNTCSGRRDYAPEKVTMENAPAPASTSQLVVILSLLLDYGADPNTLYYHHDSRIDALHEPQKTLDRACRGDLPYVASLYDYYHAGAMRHRQAGFALQAGEYEAALDVIASHGGQPLKTLCQN